MSLETLKRNQEWLRRAINGVIPIEDIIPDDEMKKEIDRICKEMGDE